MLLVAQTSIKLIVNYDLIVY